VIDVPDRLAAPDLAEQVRRLGFRGADVPAVLDAAASVAASPDDLDRVATLAGRLQERIGDFSHEGTENPLDHEAARSETYGPGVLPLLALLATAPEVAAFHAGRGIDPEVSERSLSDLGQQAWVHRQTFGGFGLHTYPWLRIAWSGALYWLGRLQFNLQPEGAEWVLSTHIPASGPLDPQGVDESFALAAAFFAEHFGDYPTRDFYCSSWLLDPELAAVLPSTSNLAAFQRRWRLFGEAMQGDDDVLFFTFFHRGPVDLDALPGDTTLRRAVIDRLRGGRHWEVWQGRIPQQPWRPDPSDPSSSEPLPTTNEPADARPAGFEAQP
jgi:hypothetical protein